MGGSSSRIALWFLNAMADELAENGQPALAELFRPMREREARIQALVADASRLSELTGSKGEVE